jgi:hypothetical protein
MTVNCHREGLSPVAISVEVDVVANRRLPRGVYPELHEILRCAQNDERRRARNDRSKRLAMAAEAAETSISGAIVLR